MRRVLLLSMLLFVGCDASQSNVNQQNFNQLEVDSATKTDVIKLMGDEYTVVFDMDGEFSVLSWEEGSGNSTRSIVITFDENDVVREKIGSNLR